MVPVNGVILAGGKALRLKQDKALLKINNESLIERVINHLTPLSQEIIIVTTQERLAPLFLANLKAKIVVDLYPGRGVLGGIYTGLVASDTFYSLVVGCDMPFLNYALLDYMIELALGFDVIIPKLNDMVEPLHAVYSRNCLSPIGELLEQGRLRAAELCNLVRTRYIVEEEIDTFDPEHWSFFNINTRADLARARERLKDCKETQLAREENPIRD